VIDEGTLRERFPEIPWDQPVPLTILGDERRWYACRYCIALHGMRAADVLAGENSFTFLGKQPAFAHIEMEHHD
jgi:hypothetical protein